MDNNEQMKMPKANVVIKSSVWYVISNFFTRALVFITTPIFTRILTTEQFGSFHVYANWQTTLMIIAGLELSATLNRARFDYTDKEFQGYITTCLVISTFITSLMLLVYLLFKEYMERLLMMDSRYIVIMFAYFYTQPAFLVFQANQRVKYKYKLSATISFFMVVFSSVLALLLAYFLTSDRLYGRIIGQYLPYVALGLFIYAYYIVQYRKPSWGKAKYALRLAIPLVFSYLGGQILLSSDKIIVQHLSSAEAVAYLGIATSCAHIMLIFVNSLNGAWSPWFYDKLAVGDLKSIEKTFSGYLWFSILCTCGVLLVGPELVLLLGGENYLSALQLLPPNIIIGSLTLIVSQFGSFETYYKKQYCTAIITAIVAGINVVIDIVGVKLFGYPAASYATVICYIVLILIHIAITSKMGALEIFPLRKLANQLLGILVLIPLSLLLYRYTIIRYFTLGIYAAAFITVSWRNRAKIIAIFRERNAISNSKQ